MSKSTIQLEVIIQFSLVAMLFIVIAAGVVLLLNDSKIKIECMQNYQTQSYKIIDDSIYCIREEYILLENQNDK